MNSFSYARMPRPYRGWRRSRPPVTRQPGRSPPRRRSRGLAVGEAVVLGTFDGPRTPTMALVGLPLAAHRGSVRTRNVDSRRGGVSVPRSRRSDPRLAAGGRHRAGRGVDGAGPGHFAEEAGGGDL